MNWTLICGIALLFLGAFNVALIMATRACPVVW